MKLKDAIKVKKEKICNCMVGKYFSKKKGLLHHCVSSVFTAVDSQKNNAYNEQSIGLLRDSSFWKRLFKSFGRRLEIISYNGLVLGVEIYITC